MYTKRDYDSSYTYSMTVFVTSVPESTRVGDETFSHSNRDIRDGMGWDGRCEKVVD